MHFLKIIKSNNLRNNKVELLFNFKLANHYDI